MRLIPARTLHAYVVFVAAAIACAGLAGCGASGTGPAPTGSIAVTITTAAGVAGAVTLSGPDGLSSTLHASRTIAGVPTGAYTVKADSVITEDSIVGARIDAPNTSLARATVVSDDTALVHVAYKFKERRGAMWVANSADTAIFEFSPDSLRVSGAPDPDGWIGGLKNPTGMALDSAGNLWVVGDESDTVTMVTAAQRATGVPPSDVEILSDTGIHNAISLALAPNGTLWISSQTTLRGYTSAQLAAGGAQSAAIVIGIAGAADAQTVGMAFDSVGNAWVADCEANELLWFTAAQLAASGSPSPTYTVGADSALTSLVCPSAIAYDREGNLWVSNFYGASIAEFSPAQLESSGTPVPQTMLTLSPQSLPWGMAFDHHGALWIGDYWHNVVDVFSPEQLASGGAVAPADTIGGPGNTTRGASFIVFDPGAPDPAAGASTLAGTAAFARDRRAPRRAVHMPAGVGIHGR
jgi:hypothetical protein